MTRLLPMIAAALVGVGAYFFFVHEPAQETAVASSTASTLSAPVAELQAADNADEDTGEIARIEDMMQGNPDAPVTVIEYASYTCPHCARFHSGTYKELKKDYIDTGKINFVYREVYFDRYGLWASMIARCAGPEKFFGVTDLIYSGQAEWSRAGEPAAIIEELRKIGRLAGLGNEQLEACLSDEGKAKSLVEWYQANAAADSIDSTPSFLINGKKYNNMNYADMSEILDDAAK